MKAGTRVSVDALKQIEVGWVQTAQGENIVVIQPIAKSPRRKMLPFGLSVDAARELRDQLDRVLLEIEQSRRPS